MMKIKKNTEKYLSLLLNTYKAFKSNKNSLLRDNSFLSEYVNEFNDSFEK